MSGEWVRTLVVKMSTEKEKESAQCFGDFKF